MDIGHWSAKLPDLNPIIYIFKWQAENQQNVIADFINSS